MTDELEKPTYESLERSIAELVAERDNLKLCLNQWQDKYYDQPKHVLTVQEPLNEIQFARLKNQCNENFGAGRFIILEGGLEYRGLTHRDSRGGN